MRDTPGSGYPLTASSDPVAGLLSRGSSVDGGFAPSPARWAPMDRDAIADQSEDAPREAK